MSMEPGGTLPRGRHGIDRDTVRAHQHERLVDATIECVAEQGYAATTVAHIVSRARVSRETFYDFFTDTADGYRAALQATIGTILTAFTTAAGADSSRAPHERLEAGLLAYFRALAERPDVATCFILEAPRGERVLGESDRASPEVVTMVSDLVGVEDAFAITAYLLMMGGVVRREVAMRRTEQLPDILPQLMPVIRRVLQI